MKAVLESVLHVGIPNSGRVRLRPKISDVVRATQTGSDQKINLVLRCVGLRRFIFLKNFLPHSSRDRMRLFGASVAANFGPGYVKSCSGREILVWNRLDPTPCHSRRNFRRGGFVSEKPDSERGDQYGCGGNSPP